MSNISELLPNIAKNTPVWFVDSKTREKRTGKFSHWTKLGEAYIKEDGTDKAYWRKPNKFWQLSEAETKFEAANVPKAMQESLVNKKFDINKRFDFLAALSRMVIKNKSTALVVTGEGGLGKTFTVTKEIEANPLMKKAVVAANPDEEDGEYTDEATKRDAGNYVIIKGFSTAKGLYKTMYENSDRLIVYDDCDEVLENPTAVNLLKAALDTNEGRIVSWISSMPANFGGSDLPPYFEFTGRIIFISNKHKHQVPQAILSRAQNIDLTMSVDDKISRMKFILRYVKPEVKMEWKEEVMEILEQYKNESRDLNMRTLIKLIEIRVSEEDENWKELAEFTILS